MKYLEDLNPEQQAAVTHGKGPLLIVAGAGTGKTTVVTQRVAWLIDQKQAEPEGILTLTFTDKAAGELEETREELEAHREEVAKHFHETSQLFRGLTEQYTRLYAHLAEGARDFCAEDEPALARGFDGPLLGRNGDDSGEEAEPAPGAAPVEARPEQANGGAPASV